VVLAQLWVVGHRGVDYLAAEETVMAGAVMAVAVVMATVVVMAAVVMAAVVMATVVGVGTLFDAHTSSP
jgi:hypothetical protein